MTAGALSPMSTAMPTTACRPPGLVASTELAASMPVCRETIHAPRQPASTSSRVEPTMRPAILRISSRPSRVSMFPTKMPMAICAASWKDRGVAVMTCPSSLTASTASTAPNMGPPGTCSQWNNRPPAVPARAMSGKA